MERFSFTADPGYPHILGRGLIPGRLFRPYSVTDMAAPPLFVPQRKRQNGREGE